MSNMRVFVLLGLLGATFAAPKTVNRIVGGSPTTVENYPYMANMQYGWFGVMFQQACGGTLLTRDAILSAAHCYVDDAASSWRVRLGTSDRSSGGEVHNVEKLIIHPRFDIERFDADVAIIRLSTAAVYSNTIAAAHIAGPNYDVGDGTSVIAIGWGNLETNGEAPKQLQHVKLDVINQELCAERYAFLKTQPGFSRWPDITSGMMCAGILNLGGKDACQGDSGGPVSHINNDIHIVVGVTSWGYRCADSFYPGVFARVSSYTEWIVDHAQAKLHATASHYTTDVNPLLAQAI